MADFKFFLNRQGPKGEPGAKGDKGDNGNTPTFSDGINTPTVYTMQIDMGDGNVFETQNLKYPMRDDGGNYLRYDRTNSTVTLSAPNIADLQRTSGEVTLASVSDVENEDTQDTDAVSMELRNADQLALSNVVNRIDGDINAVDNKVDSEIQNRQNADTALSGRIDGLDSSKADKTDVYTKAQTDALLNGKANTVHTHNLSQITDAGSLAGKNTVDYSTEVTNKPTIGNGTITITQGGVTKGTFTTNQSGNSTIALDAGGGGGATYTAGPGITINQNDEISANVDNNTIVIDGNLLKANIPDVSNFVSNTQLASTLESYPTNNALSNAITYRTVSVPTPATYTFDRIMNLYIWEYSTNLDIERDGRWTKVGTSTYTRNSQLVIPSDSSYNNGLWVTLLNLQDTECVKCNSDYTFSFECNPQIAISYYSPEDGDTLITQLITINTPTNEVFNISSSSYGYTSLNIGVLKNIYIKSLMVQYSYDSNGHTPSVFLTPIYDSNGEVEVYTRSEGIPVTTTKAVVADTAVDGSTISIDSNGQLTYIGPTGDVLPSQSGNSGKFLTTDGGTTSWATVSQPDMTQYYTKTQTDSLLDGKINTTAPTAPIAYQTASGKITYQNVNESTMIGNGKGVDVVYNGSSSYRIYVGTQSGEEEFRISSDKVALISNSSLTWFEAELPNGINFAFQHVIPNTSNTYTAVIGHYDNNIFIPDAISGNDYTYSYSEIYIVNTDKWYGKTNYAYPNQIIGFYLLGTSLTIRSTGNGGGVNSVTITQEDADILNSATHIRIYNGDYPLNTLSLSDIKAINPTIATPVTDTSVAMATLFANNPNIFEVVQESLYLKYDGTTLGVNANNELYAIPSTPSNMVTTNTNQDITAQKNFTNTQVFSGTQYYSNTDGIQLGKDMTICRTNSSPANITLMSNESDLITFADRSNDTIGVIAAKNQKFRLVTPGNDKKIYRENSTPASNPTNFLLEKDMIDGTTITYNSSTGKISATANPPVATSSSTGIVQPDNSTITVDGNGVISAVNNSIAKTAPVAPLEYEETEDGVSVGIGGTLNHTNYTSSVDKVYVYDVTVPNINNQSGDGYFTQSAANMMSKIFYKGYKIRLDNGLNIAWNVAESSGFFMNVAIGYYDNGTFIPVLYALNDASYGGQMFARPAMEFGSDIYSIGRLTTQFEECVGISLVGDVLNGFSPRSGVHPYTISDTTLLAEMRKCTHAICTVVNESNTGTSFNYSTGKFANPETSLIAGSEAGRHAIFSAAENLILNTDTIVVPELKLNYDSTYFKVVNNQLTLDIQAIKDAIDALSNSSGTAS